MALVHIVGCNSYSRETVDAKVRQLLQNLPAFTEKIKPGIQVLLKVNLLSPTRPDKAVTTHPEVVRAVSRYLLELGAKVSVGDSSGGIIPGGSRTSRALEVSGIRAVVEEVGGKVINFDATGVVEVSNPRGGSWENLYVAKPVLDADIVISMPKLKTHMLTMFTGAIKNMYGCVPGSRKAWYHQIAPGIDEFSDYLVDIFSVTNTHLAIMDGIVGMEGDGPAAGQQRQIGALLASEDCVALDAVSCKLVGIHPSKVAMLPKAAKRGFGVLDPKLADINGPFQRLRVTDFKKRKRGVQPPRFVTEKALSWLQAYPVIDQAKCIDCDLCFNSCPVKTIERREQGLAVKPENCIRCYCCHELCPETAIKLQSSRLADWLMSLYHRRYR